MALFVKVNGSVFNNSGLLRVGELKTAPIELADQAALMHYIFGVGLSTDNQAGTGGNTTDVGAIILQTGAKVSQTGYFDTPFSTPANGMTIMVAVTATSDSSPVTLVSSDNLTNGISLLIDPSAKTIRGDVRGIAGSAATLSYSSIETLPVSIISFRSNNSTRDVQIINKSLKAISNVPCPLVQSTATARIGSSKNQFTQPGYAVLPEVAVFDAYLTDEKLAEKYLQMKIRLAQRGIVVAE